MGDVGALMSTGIHETLCRPQDPSPVYVRGEAYLAEHRGVEAAGEFQRVVDHRAIVQFAPIEALAHLQLGRAYAMSGDKDKAKSAYQDFPFGKMQILIFPS